MLHLSLGEGNHKYLSVLLSGGYLADTLQVFVEAVIWLPYDQHTIMETGHLLKNLLQSQLASEASSVSFLPYILSSLTRESFLPSTHTSKWSTRIHSLLHSKDAGARWAGLCLAHKTSLLSQSLMIESAQSWIGVALPLLSVCILFWLSVYYISPMNEEK